jgi:predicted RNA-binding Zn-ribbon protein involved in translation (DUF1610 family)
MLTPKQAAAAADALAMHPTVERAAKLACTACGGNTISQLTRRDMGIFKRIPCPHCGALLRLKRGRTLLGAYLLVVTITGIAAFMKWPTDRHFVESLASPFIAMMFVILTTTLRRLPLAAD